MGFGSTKYVEEKTILENLKDSSPLRQGGSFVNSSELSLFVIRHEITFREVKKYMSKLGKKPWKQRFVLIETYHLAPQLL